MDEDYSYFPYAEVKHPVTRVHVCAYEKFYCTSCNTKLCDGCLFPGHMKCRLVPEKSYVNKLAGARTREYVRDFKRLITGEINAGERFSSTSEKIRAAIEERTERLKSALDAEKEVLLEKVSVIENEKNQLWEMHRMRCESTLKDLYNWKFRGVESLSRMVRSVVSLTTEGKKLRDSCDSAARFEPGSEDEMKIGKLRLPPFAANTRIDVRGKTVVNTCNTCVVDVRDVLNERVAGDAVYALDVTLTDENGGNVFFTLTELKNGEILVKFYPARTGTYKLFVSIDSRQVIDSPRDVCVVEKSDEDETPQPILAFGGSGSEDGQFTRPWGVCCDAYGRILVSDRCNNRIQIFTEDGGFQGKFGRKGSGPGEFDRPAGIAVDKFSRIIVADKDNHRIQIFDSDGMYITHFGKFEDEELSLHYPWDVSVNSHCNIAVTESKRRRVSLFTDSGILLRRFRFSPETDLESPRGITCARDDSFVVTDHDRHKLIILDKNMEEFMAFGSRGSGEHQFFRPQCVASDVDGTFAVVDCKNHRVKVFKGNRLFRTFGRLGKDYGEFDAPQGIAFHPKGWLVVVDYGNSRIQVFDVGHR